MFKRLSMLLVMAGFAFAQEDADIPPRFRNLITPEQYFQLRDNYLNLLRGLPADPSLREDAVRQMQTQQARRPLLATTPSWTPLGPSPIPNGQVTGSLPVTGRVTALEIDPTNSSKLYLGTAQGGIYRSLDGGTTWTQIFDGAKSSAIGALALAPSNPATLFVGTGEANLSGDSYAGVGLYRIDNADTSATLVGPINPVRNYNDSSGNPQSVPVFNGRSITSILVHPTDPSIVFVGTTSGVIGIGGDPPFGGSNPPLGMLGIRGLYRLTNATGPTAGVVVQKLTVTLAPGTFNDSPNTGNRSVTSMVFEPGNPNDLIVWIYGFPVAGDGGIYRSTNAQAANPSFTQVLTASTNTAGTIVPRGQLAVYKQAGNPAVVYSASGEGPSGTGRLRVSTDGGVTWSAFLAGGQGFCGGQCFYNIGLDIRPGATPAQDLIVLGGQVPGSGATPSRLFAKSTNGGATFTESSSGLHADTHFIKIDPTNPNVIYHGDDGGIFKSIDAGAHWVSLNTMPLNTVQFSGLSVHPIDAKLSLGGTQDNGTNMRMPDGSWRRVDYGDGGYALIDRTAPDTTHMTLYHTYFNQTNGLIGFARVLSAACAFDISPSGVLGWAFKGIYGGSVDPTPECDSSDTFNGISITDPVIFYAPMELGPGNPSTVYFGAGKVYRSSDKGETMPAVSQASTTQPVASIAVSPQDDNYRMFGRTDGSLFYTTTGANPMTALTGIPAKFVGRVKFDPSNKNTAYVALGGYFGGTGTSQSHVWRVTNLSTAPVVTGINTGLPDVPVNAFAVDPANSNALFAGTDIGVYASTDGGASWAPFGTGLPVVAVFGAEIQPQSRTLRIATHGRGMWDIGLGPALVPDLTITKTHVGNFTQGQKVAIYTITVTNSGTAATSGTVTVTDTLPPGVTAIGISSIGWTCTLSPLTCTRSDSLAAGSSYPAITLTVNVAANATSGVNTATVSGGGETNLANDTATDATTILPGSPTGFTITNYVLVNQQAGPGRLAFLTYRADLLNNTGMAFSSVTATLTSLDPFNIRVVPGQDTLVFAPVPVNAQVTSLNTFMIIADPTVPLDTTKLLWTFQTKAAKPVANPGPNQTVKVGSTVILDGSGSTNPSGVGSLTYSWMFTSRPPGTATRLFYETSPIAMFLADAPGTYVISLTVSNGVDSSTASVTITVTP